MKVDVDEPAQEAELVVVVDREAHKRAAAIARGLALMLKINLPDEKLTKEEDLYKELGDIEFYSDHTKTRLFCGGVEVEGELRPTVWVEQEYQIIGNYSLMVRLGVEAGIRNEGITAQWLGVEVKSSEGAKVEPVMVVRATSGGGKMFARGGKNLFNIEMLKSESALNALLANIKYGITREVIERVDDIDWVGAVMRGIVSRKLLPYNPKSEREIWRMILAAVE